MATLEELERAAEAANKLPSGVLASIRQQETGGSSKYIDDPTTYHYQLDSSGRRVAGHTGKVSTAFGPYGILESTGADPGYGTQPLKSKALEDQVNFAASYLANRSARAGSLEAGLAGYGEGGKYANQVLKRINNMATPTATQPSGGNEIDNLAAGNMQRNDVAAQALERTYADMGGAYKRAQASLAGSAEDSSLVMKTKALAEAEAQQKSQVFAATIGADPTVATYAMNKLILESQQLYEAKQAAGRKLAAAANPEGKSFFEFLGDRITLPNRVREFATLDALEKNATQRLSDINTLTQSVARTNNAVAQSVTTESALAMSRMATSEAAQKMAGLEIDALKTNSASILQVTQLQNNNLDIALRRRDQQIQEISVVTARQKAALQGESLKMALQDRTDQMKDKAEVRQGEEQMLTAINVGRKLSNLPEIRSLVELRTMAKMGEKQGIPEQFAQQYSQGLVAAQTGRATVAETPFDTLRYVKGTGATFDDGRARVVEFLDKTLGQIQNDPKIPAADKQKEKFVSSAVNSLALNQAAAMQQDITSGGKDNIYQAPPTATFLKDPGFASTYLAQKILTPMHKGGMETLPIREATSALMQDMIAGKITPAQVDSELGYLGTKIMGYNNELYRYKDTAGIPDMSVVGVRLDDASATQSFVNRIAGPGTPGYQMPVSRALWSVAGGSGEKLVNLADPVSRSDYINRQLASYIPPVLRQQAVVQQQSKTGSAGSISPYAGRTSSGKVGQE